MNLELASFKKIIKREASAYSVLKDECFFDKFQRDLFIIAKSHGVSEILDPTFSEEKDLFEAKQVFMYKVFNEVLQTDMGRTRVRKYLKTTDAQAVWKEYSEYMTTSSKGASEKKKLTHYVTNTVLDNQFRGTPSNLSCTSMSNSGDWMNSLTYLKECQTPSRWHSFRELSRTFPSSVLLKLLMNTLPPLLEVDHSLTSTTHPTTISSSMLVLGMTLPIHQLLPKERMYMQLLVPRISPLLWNPTKHSSLKT